MRDLSLSPQAARRGFGLGNLGTHGMDKFLDTHHCNKICEYLQLPRVVAGRTWELPATPVRKHQCKPPIPFTLADYVPPLQQLDRDGWYSGAVVEGAEVPSAETLSILGVSSSCFAHVIGLWRAVDVESKGTLSRAQVDGILQQFEEPDQKEWVHKNRHDLDEEVVSYADFVGWCGRMERDVHMSF